MNSPKRMFSIGDKVVTVDSPKLSCDQKQLVGATSIVTGYKSDPFSRDGLYVTTDKTWGYYAYEIVAESVYHSPVYKLLENR